MISLWCAYLKWEIGNGSFSLQTTIGACVLSMSVVYFVNRKLQDSYFVLFFRGRCLKPGILLEANLANTLQVANSENLFHYLVNIISTFVVNLNIYLHIC